MTNNPYLSNEPLSLNVVSARIVWRSRSHGGHFARRDLSLLASE